MKKLLFAAIPFSYLLILLFQTDLAMLGDLGRHLKLGEIVTKCLCVPQVNLFSYTNTNFPIINHEWLAEVVFYLVAAASGLKGLLIFKMIIIIVSAGLLYLVALKKGSLFWVTIFSLVSITIFSMRFFVLPELFSYLFISIFIFLIEKFKQTKKIYLLLFLPFLELLWVNMHIYFIIGISIYAFFFLENIVKQKAIDESPETLRSRLPLLLALRKTAYLPVSMNWILRSQNKKLLLIGILLISSTLINPSFLKGALLPFTFSTNYGFNVEENNSPLKILQPTSTNINIAYTLVLQIITFEILIGLFIIALFIKKQRKEVFHMGNGVTAAFLGLKFTRCVSLFGLLGFIPLAQAFTRLEEKVRKNIDPPTLHVLKGVVVLCVAIIVGIHFKGLADYKILHFGFMKSSENATEFIKQANIKGKIFNNYIIGNYLIFALYPQKQVYVDARPEAYPASFFDDYWKMMADEKFFNSQVEKYGINVVVFNVAFEDPVKSRPFLLRLIESKEWIPVYADGTVTIFVRNNGENKKIVDRYKINI